MTATQTPVLTELTTVRARQASAPKPPPLPADAETAPPASAPDLGTLTDEALSALVTQGEAEMVRRKEKKEADFLAFVAETAKTLGVGPARLAAAVSRKSARPRSADSGDGRSNVRPKFWCVADHSLRWSGRGGAPKWFADHISSGGKEEDMRIPEDHQ